MSAKRWTIVATALAVIVVGDASGYKWDQRDAMIALAEGRVEDARARVDAYLSEHPDDAEALYTLVAAQVASGAIEDALATAARAVDAGLPVSRFVAGPREWFRPLTERPEFRALAKGHATSLLHGPMLGSVTHFSARVWVRTAREAVVSVEWRALTSGEASSQSASASTRADMDYTARVDMRSLAPNTAYSYSVSVDGAFAGGPWTFRTFPTTDRPARFSVGFGGGGGYTPENERVWNTIASHSPSAFLLLGDNVYIDVPRHPTVQRAFYYRRQARPEFRNFTARSSIYAIWDDHDFVTNDKWGGPEINEPAWKVPVWDVFRENWVNPSYGFGEARPGCWFTFRVGDVRCIMLDGRYYRTDPSGADPTMLGPEQKAWLFDTLTASDAAFTVLASPVPWAAGTKPGSKDTWDGYPRERAEILTFLSDRNIPGVVLLSADRHRSDVWTIPRDGDYTLYEFESSKLTNLHTHKPMPGAAFSYNEKCSFGMLDFDTTLDDPTVTYRIVSIDNEPIHRLTLRRSQLQRP
jgi:alkaline phosphatase D